MYQTRNTVFDHISKHQEVRQKYFAARPIFNLLLGVWKCGQTWSFVFDILRKTIISYCCITEQKDKLDIHLPPVLFVKDQPMVKNNQVLICLQTI